MRTLISQAPSPGPDRLPVAAAAGKQRAGQPLTRETAAGDDADAAIDTGRLADGDRRIDREQKREQRPHAQLVHFLGQNFR